MTLLIANRQRARKVNGRVLKEITATLLRELAGPKASLEINLVSPQQMARVNQTHLQHEGPTDVITFDYRETLTRRSTVSCSFARRWRGSRRVNSGPTGGQNWCVM